MCICVDAFGTGFDILVYVHLMKGECGGGVMAGYWN